MAHKRIFLIRHGQTNFNKQRIVQGSGVDTDINEMGRMQSRAFFERYKDINFDKIYISKLKRTFQTVADFIEKSIPYKRLAGLNEICWGEREGKCFDELDPVEYERVAKAWESGNFDAKPRFGQSPLELQAKQKEALAHIMAQTNEKDILICSHGRAMRILLCTMLELPLNQMDSFAHTNTGLYILEYLDGKYYLRAVNDCSHLSAISSTKISWQ